MPTAPTQRRYQRHRSIWLADDGWGVEIIDQAALPSAWISCRLSTAGEVIAAIVAGQVRGPGLVAVAAAYAMGLAARRDPGMIALMTVWRGLVATDPRCPRLRGVLDRMREVLDVTPPADRALRAYQEAALLAEEELAVNRAIGRHAMGLLRRIGAGGGGGRPQTILLLSEPGWLSSVGWGAASAALFLAQEEVDRHRASGGMLGEAIAPPHVVTVGPLAAWEMVEAGIPHSPCDLQGAADLVRRGVVEQVFATAYRALPNGDSLVPAGYPALAALAREAGIPLHLCLPAAAINWLATNPASITMAGMEILPLALVSGFVTDRGLCPADIAALADRFPDHEPVRIDDLPVANDA